MQVPLSSVLFFASIIVLGIEGLVDALAYPVAVEVPVPVLVPVGMRRFIDEEEEEEAGEDNDHTQPLDSEDEEDVEDLLELEEVGSAQADAVASH